MSQPPQACYFSPPAVLTVHHQGFTIKVLASWTCLSSVALCPCQRLQPTAEIQRLSTTSDSRPQALFWLGWQLKNSIWTSPLRLFLSYLASQWH